MPITFNGKRGRAALKERKMFLYREQGGACHWCQRRMNLYFRNVNPNPPDLRRATLDHLDDRLSPNRGKTRGERRTVLACWECNQRRSLETSRKAHELGLDTLTWHPTWGYGSSAEMFMGV